MTIKLKGKAMKDNRIAFDLMFLERAILLLIFPISTFLIGCDRSPPFRELIQELPPEAMPAFEEDVLWISSVPLGAEVIVFEKEKGQIFPPQPDNDAQSKAFMFMTTHSGTEIKHKTGPFIHEVAGVTPLKLTISPGVYCVAVQLDVSSENIEFSFYGEEDQSSESPELDKIYTDSDILELYTSFGRSEVGFDKFYNPSSYLQDGNMELWALYAKGHLKKISKIYEIEKEDGKPSTLIALFQHKDEKPDKIFNELPLAYKFNERSMLTPDLLEIWGIPKKESQQFHERLHRGGKALICDSRNDYMMVELKPVEIDISKNSKSGGYTMSMAGKYLGLD
jgi:hypothetical protein